jgi:hypothetical protein
MLCGRYNAVKKMLYTVAAVRKYPFPQWVTEKSSVHIFRKRKIYFFDHGGKVLVAWNKALTKVDDGK